MLVNDMNGNAIRVKYMVHFIAVVLCVLTKSVFAESYYVSKDNGSDNNSGLSWVSAWRTVVHAGKMAKAGDTVNIRKSSIPYSFIRIHNKGTKQNPIVFKGEQGNESPILSGGLKLTAWTQVKNSGVWMHPVVYKSARFLKITSMLIEDNRPLVKVEGTSPNIGEWSLDENYIYYNPTSKIPDDHSLRALGYSAGVIAHNTEWIIIENITCDLSPGACVSIKNGHDITVRGITSNWSWRGVDISENSNNNLVESSRFFHNREAVYIRNKSNYNTIDNCVIKFNGQYPLWINGDRHAVGIGEGGPNIGNKVQNNIIENNGAPPDNVALIAFRAPESIFNNNYIRSNYGSGLFITTDSDNSKVVNNIVSGNGQEAVRQGIKGIAGLSVRNSKYVVVENNIITDNHVSNDSVYKNVYVGKHGGLDIEGAAKADMRGIVLKNNVVTGTVGGPNLHISKRPNVQDITIINQP